MWAFEGLYTHQINGKDDVVAGNLPSLHDSTRDGLVKLLVLLVQFIKASCGWFRDSSGSISKRVKPDVVEALFYCTKLVLGALVTAVEVSLTFHP